MSQNRLSWFKSGGPGPNQVILGPIRWSWVKSGGPGSNQVILGPIRWSWVKSGGPGSNQAVVGQISQSWVKSGGSGWKQPLSIIVRGACACVWENTSICNRSIWYVMVSVVYDTCIFLIACLSITKTGAPTEMFTHQGHPTRYSENYLFWRKP